jgi:ABC-type multidrug transport system permease subunit
MGTSYDYRLVITFPIFLVLYSVCETVKEKLIILLLMLSIMYGGNLPFKLSGGGMIFNAISDAVLVAFTSLISLILLKLNLGKNVSYK